jgi:para-nitrobenzyl esterase
MVYFHGGGFAFGSSYELLSHDGANMARNHDVVQVSINHRLNVLGFLDLADHGGAAYRDSVNCSMMDCIAALRWVQENIANFGGDPDKVMIYGQSGGGSKVTTMLGMPAGKGLIHRAAIMSGGGGNIPTLEQSRELSHRLIKELGIAKGDMAALQKADWNTLITAGNKVASDINGPARPNPLVMGPGAFANPRVGFGPTLDGRTITVRSYQDVGPETSRDVPVLIGNVSEEGTGYGRNPSEGEWRQQLSDGMGAEKARQLIGAMKKAHPEKSVRTLSYGVQGLSARNNVQRMVKLKHAQNAAPAYQYLFQWQSPQLDGVAGAWHTAELAFCFDNTDLCAQATGGGAQPRMVGRRMSTAWANFARTGNPSQPGLTWTPSDPARAQTMVFDTQSRMVDDPEGDVRRILLG